LYAAAIRRANLRALSANDMKSSRAGGMMSRLASWRRTVVGGQGRPGRTDVPSRQAPGSAPITARRHVSSLIGAASPRTGLAGSFHHNECDRGTGVPTTLKAVLRHAPEDIQPKVKNGSK